MPLQRGNPCRIRGRAQRIAVLVALAVALIAPALGAPGPSGAKKDEIATAAPSAILVDAESGSILFEKNADQLMPPANLAKLMTAEVVFNEIKQGRISLDTEYIVSEYAWRHGGAPSHTTSMFAPIHSKVAVKDLLYGVIVQSANDACITLAEGIAGSEDKFAQMMTARARELGLTKSYFPNGTGLPDPTLVMSVRDLAKLARHIILNYPEFYPIYGEKEFTWNRIRQQNRNPLLGMGIGADGLSTGSSDEGGFGLVGSAVQNGERLIVVMNGLRTAAERANEGKRLLEWGYKAFEHRSLFAEGEAIGEAKVFGGTQGSVPLVATGAVSLLMPRDSTERLTARIVYTGPVPAPVHQGQPIGQLRVWRGENMVLEVPLQAGASVATGGMTRRAFDAATEFVIGLFLSGTKRI
ncbi:MAG TPA: D-alanyl-D-alanine carboxypeptidase family protein [Xanthobacteraceae bacterium]|jgi:serine-type D-Ala-D-Ala carboxypeptidase (penicillin-binding protein 5/6)|nr:D-alanyl-D-alanine carboxypeptidase family protein [Xanthobacteraceae bacterium]